jgi:hypothetical protein
VAARSRYGVFKGWDSDPRPILDGARFPTPGGRNLKGPAKVVKAHQTLAKKRAEKANQQNQSHA